MKTIALPVSRRPLPPGSALITRMPDFIALTKPRVKAPAVSRPPAPLVCSGPDSANNVPAFAPGVLTVVLVAAGSIFIMANLNENMMPSADLMNLHMQH